MFCIFLARDTDPLTETEKEITYVMLFIQWQVNWRDLQSKWPEKELHERFPFF